MKQILTIAMLLTSLASYAQDTLCVMVCLDRVLHFADGKKRFRDVTTTFNDGDHSHETFNTKNNVVFSNANWPSFVINISEARRKK